MLEIATYSAGDGKRREFSALGTILYGTTPRLLQINGIACEAPLEGKLLIMTNRDVPGVIGQVGTLLGSQGLNIATFALGRRAAQLGAEALAIVQLDGDVPSRSCPACVPFPTSWRRASCGCRARRRPPLRPQADLGEPSDAKPNTAAQKAKGPAPSAPGLF